VVQFSCKQPNASHVINWYTSSQVRDPAAARKHWYFMKVNRPYKHQTLWQLYSKNINGLTKQQQKDYVLSSLRVGLPNCR
jgi:hypothetical protein